MKAHSELLGLGLDQSTSITVHGDVMTVNGPDRVAVWDGNDHGGKGYYYLRAGDKLDTVTRVATMVEHPPDPVAGKYQIRPDEYMTITVERGQLVSQLTGQGKVPLFARSDGKFFPKVVKAELEFVKSGDGKVAELVLHQNGASVPMKRLDDAEVKRMADEAAAKAAFAAQRYKDQKQAPASEEALRRVIGEVRAGEPKYDQMSAEAAQRTANNCRGSKRPSANWAHCSPFLS